MVTKPTAFPRRFQSVTAHTTHVTFGNLFFHRRPCVHRRGSGSDIETFCLIMAVVKFQQNRVRFAAIYTRVLQQIINQCLLKKGPLVIVVRFCPRLVNHLVFPVMRRRYRRCAGATRVLPNAPRLYFPVKQMEWLANPAFSANPRFCDACVVRFLCVHYVLYLSYCAAHVKHFGNFTGSRRPKNGARSADHSATNGAKGAAIPRGLRPRPFLPRSGRFSRCSQRQAARAK